MSVFRDDRKDSGLRKPSESCDGGLTSCPWILMYGYNIEEKVTEVLENSRKMFVRRVNFLPSMKQSLITDLAFFFL